MTFITVWRVVLAAALALGAAVVIWFLLPSRMTVQIPQGLSSANAGMGERGAYLVRAAGCVSCHWDKKNKGEPFAGGLVFKTDFGVLYSPNITPDIETGIGHWSDEEFVRALTVGEGIHGEELYPALPYTSYSKMRVEDALAIRAHLMSLPAISAPHKANELSFPFSWRALLKAWKLFYFEGPAPLREDPARDAAWNRGHYLVVALGHCAECHTPRNAFGARIGSLELQGNPKGVNGWKVPALVGPHAKDFDSWSVDETAAYLKSGMKPDFDSAQGPMAEVIEDGTKHLSDDDRRAIATYLKSLKSQ